MGNLATKNSNLLPVPNNIKSKDLKNVHFCAYVRHGERADEVFHNYEKAV